LFSLALRDVSQHALSISHLSGINPSPCRRVDRLRAGMQIKIFTV
jgi:hypothetical protein